MSFTIHSVESAPHSSRPLLENIVENYGFLPNLAGGLAESPALLKGYLDLAGLFDSEDMTLTKVERQVVLLTTSVLNQCDYCTAAHSMLADRQGLESADLERLVSGQELSDARLEALRRFTRSVVENRGWVGDDEVQDFLAAGFERRQVLEVVHGVVLKTLTNYANHLISPEINEQFAAYAPQRAA